MVEPARACESSGEEETGKDRRDVEETMLDLQKERQRLCVRV